jgi:hypothetical protein
MHIFESFCPYHGIESRETVEATDLGTATQLFLRKHKLDKADCPANRYDIVTVQKD